MRKIFAMIVIVVVTVVTMAGCMKPPEVNPVVTIGNNETAFVISLEGNSQTKNMTKELLAKSQVYSKRITVPLVWRQTGRFEHDGEWLPTIKILVVDRSPVAREWTKSKDSGTDSKNQGIGVESKDSIGFSVGISIVARIDEDNAATFLYFYPATKELPLGAKGNFDGVKVEGIKMGTSLDGIMDAVVRRYISQILAREYGKYDLDEGKQKKNDIVAVCLKETREHFAEQGITIDSLGISEGMWYDDEEIQDAINRKFVVENDRQVATQEQEAQKIRNATDLARSETQLKVARNTEAAEKGFLIRRELELRDKWLDILEKFSQKWKGDVPANWAILPESLLGMFAK